MSRQADQMRTARQRFAAPGGSLDRIVRLLAFGLPALVGAVAATMLIAPLKPRGEISFLLDRNKVAVANDRLSVSEAVYRGEDTKGRPFALSDAVVHELLCDGSTFRLEPRFYEERRPDFTVEDATGVVLVEPKIAAVSGDVLRGNVRDPDARLRNFLRVRALAPANLGWSERSLRDGRAVIVRGEARLEPGVGRGAKTRGYRDAPLRLILRAVVTSPEPKAANNSRS